MRLRTLAGHVGRVPAMHWTDSGTLATGSRVRVPQALPSSSKPVTALDTCSRMRTAFRQAPNLSPYQPQGPAAHSVEALGDAGEPAGLLHRWGILPVLTRPYFTPRPVPEAPESGVHEVDEGTSAM